MHTSALSMTSSRSAINGIVFVALLCQLHALELRLDTTRHVLPQKDEEHLLQVGVNESSAGGRSSRVKLRSNRSGLHQQEDHHAGLLHRDPFEDHLDPTGNEVFISETSTDRLWNIMRDIPATEHLWPYPAKVGVVIALFVVFEYLLDIISHCGPNWNLLPLNVSPNRQLQEETDRQKDPTLLRRLRVLTLNVWVNYARENSERQIGAIRDLAPDVICLQEVFHLDVLEQYRTAFPDYCMVAFGRAHNLSAVIALVAIMLAVAAAFSGAVWAVETFVTDGMWRTVWILTIPIMFAVYSRQIRHHWTIAFLTGNRTGLAMLVKRDTVDIEERQCATFSRAGHAADILNVLRPRGYISVLGKLRLPGCRALPVRFVTTHLNQPLEQALGDGRHRQVKEVFQNCMRDGELFVLGCDLNATPPGTQRGSDCNTYCDVTKHMTDAWAMTNPDDPNRDGLTWDQTNNPMCASLLNQIFYGLDTIRWRCDYIFWRFGKHGTQATDEPVEIQPQDPDDKVSIEKLDKTVNIEVEAPFKHGVECRTCEMVFVGKEAVSDHYGVHAVFDIHDIDSEAAPPAAKSPSPAVSVASPVAQTP